MHVLFFLFTYFSGVENDERMEEEEDRPPGVSSLPRNAAFFPLLQRQLLRPRGSWIPPGIIRGYPKKNGIFDVFDAVMALAHRLENRHFNEKSTKMPQKL